MQEENKNDKQPTDEKKESKIKLCCALAYLWILFFIPLIFCPNDERSKFHANQGLILFIVMLILNALMTFINLFVPGVVKNILYTLVEFYGIAMSILGILNVCNNKMVRLPLIGKFNIIK